MRARKGSTASTPASADSEAEADLARVQAVLPDDAHEEDFYVYARLFNGRRIQGNSIDYKVYRVNRRKRGAVTIWNSSVRGWALSASVSPC